MPKRNQISHMPAKLEEESIRLNKLISNAGICSRRKADELIIGGKIKVNGVIVKEVGLKVKRSDTVLFKNNKINSENNVYVLLNKPKNYISTSTDPFGRKTVCDLIQKKFKERIYPVGRLDRNTTGLLLFTNDGELCNKLLHPSQKVKKIYEVTLNEDISDIIIQKIKQGIILEDGVAEVDYIRKLNSNVLLLEIHSGKNRIIRRIFESLNLKVIKLDRLIFGNLDKKKLPRGKWRILTIGEVNLLKKLIQKNDI